VTEQEEMALSCTRRGLDWIAGKISSLKGFSSIGIGYRGRWLSSPSLEVFKRRVDVPVRGMV